MLRTLLALSMLQFQALSKLFVSIKRGCNSQVLGLGFWLRPSAHMLHHPHQRQIQDFGQGGPSRVLTPGGTLSQNLLKIGVFPIKLPEKHDFEKNLGGQVPLGPLDKLVPTPDFFHLHDESLEVLGLDLPWATKRLYLGSGPLGQNSGPTRDSGFPCVVRGFGLPQGNPRVLSLNCAFWNCKRI